MQIVLEITSGPRSGQKVRLGAGQELKIGRTEWADFSVPEDGHMSGVHFALETDGLACYLIDLESSNGTFLNGQQVPANTKITLGNGDEVLAGQTSFVMHAEVEPHRQPPAESAQSPTVASVEPTAVSLARPIPAAPAMVPPRSAGQLTYTAEKCASGLTLCRGACDQIPPQDVATLLCQVYPVYLIVDFRNLGTPRPEELESVDYLFDWLDAEAAEGVSPVVLAQTDFLAWPDLVAQGWGADAVVCLYSSLDKPAMLDHLRQALRAKPQGDDMSGGMLGYCWPSVMSMLLAHSPRDLVDRLLSGTEAVLVELPDLPETWQLFGGNQLRGVLEKIGFTETETETETDVRTVESPDGDS
jgi:pSer/pThr/pTyr-binding forkhead associated (FHA) protein